MDARVLNEWATHTVYQETPQKAEGSDALRTFMHPTVGLGPPTLLCNGVVLGPHTGEGVDTYQGGQSSSTGVVLRG